MPLLSFYQYFNISKSYFIQKPSNIFIYWQRFMHTSEVDLYFSKRVCGKISNNQISWNYIYQVKNLIFHIYIYISNIALYFILDDQMENQM